ncbi:unnamed protein product [Ilex paraguariensis]|uniref:serine O-acetyltransferase n=1 Tax=Ilex paraguariensis TaxID=185542 RepID=A0ABC8UMN0_9AQUA
MAACLDDSRNQTATICPCSADFRPVQNNNSLCRLIKFCRPTVFKLSSCNLVYQKSKSSTKIVPHECDEDYIWLKIQEEALSSIEQEPILSKYFYSSILSHCSVESALANQLAIKLSNSSLPTDTLYEIFFQLLSKDSSIRVAIRDDLKAVKERDPAWISYVHCFLNFKGFLACQAHRMAHNFWLQGRTVMALLIQNRVSEVFAVDIHPGAKIGRGILLDHATGIVIGETAVIGDNVSILHSVTLGGTGKVSGDRHPKIGDGVQIGAGTKILGNIKIGEGAKIGAGSVVLKEVPPKATAVGNPARIIAVKDR